MQMRGPGTALGVALAITSAATPSFADDVQRADELFSEGRALLERDLNKACELFEQSLQLNAQAIGTLLNVALCDEKLGRYATAYERFREARDRAKEQGMKAHLEAAEQHLADLEGKVPKVTLRFAEPPLPDTKIVIDDELIPFASIANHPIDPGDHELVVSAPGHLAFKTHITIREGEPQDVTIPKLERAVTIKSSRRTIGKITSATGVIAIGTGVAIGLIARSRAQGTLDRNDCWHADVDGNQELQCNDRGYADAKNARTLGTVGSVVGGVGLAAVGVGLYLWLSAPSERSEPRVSVVPQVGPEAAGIMAVGRF